MSAIRGFDGKDVELYHEPFLGWRGWKWDTSQKRLRSMNNVVWTPFEELHAECRQFGTSHSHGDSGHDAPAVNCNCGIFSMKAPQWLDRHIQTEDRATVIGTIKMWGNIVEGSVGYRAEYAMIDSLYVACSDAELTKMQYMKFMYDIDGERTPSYLRSVMGDEIEGEYGVTVYRHDPRETFVIPEEWPDLPSTY